MIVRAGDVERLVGDEQMGGEITDAWKNLTGNVGSLAGKAETGITVAAYASVGACLFAMLAWWNTRRR